MGVAIVRLPSPRFSECELTFIDRVPIDVQLAMRQHANYCAALAEGGLQVIPLPASNEFPDSSFVEDTAVVLDEIAILCMPGAASRRGEIASVANVLRMYRQLREIALPATLDGGDVLRLGRQLLVGLSMRTSRRAAEALQEIVSPFGYEVLTVTVRGSLHLKTACTGLDDETVLLNTSWVDRDAFPGKHILHIDSEEPFAANTLRLGDKLLMNAACPNTISIVRDAGYFVEGIDISEFSKAEAGLTCMSLIFDGVGAA